MPLVVSGVGEAIWSELLAGNDLGADEDEEDEDAKA